MELLYLFGILFFFAGPVALILVLVAFKRIGQLRSEVMHLSELVKRWESPAAEPAAVEPSVATRRSDTEPAPRPIPAIPAPKPAEAPKPRPASRPSPSRRREIDLESILGGQWLTWIGVLALFFGTAFFLGVDLGDHVMSGLPQVLVGLVVAGLFSGLGRYWSSRRERTLGLGLLGGGVALLYLAVYAAYGFHQLIPLWVAFPPLLGVAAVGATLALERNSLALATLTLTGALLTPVVLSGGGDPTYALLPYLVGVNLGAVLVGRKPGWAGLALGSFVVTLVLVAGWWDAHFRTGLRAYAFVCVTAGWLVYAIAPWMQRPAAGFWSAARAALLAGNGLFYGLFCYHLVAPGAERWRGAVLVILAIVYLGISRWMRRKHGEDEATRLTHLTGVALAVVAVPVQFDLAWITVAWTALAGILLLSGLRESDLWQRISGAAVLAVVLARSVVVMFPITVSPPADYRPVWNGEFLAGLLVVALLGWLYWAYRRYSDRLTKFERRVRPTLLVMAVSTLAWKLTQELVAWFALRETRLGVDQGVSLVLTMMLFWAIYGLGVINAGSRIGQRPLRIIGHLLLGASAFVTVWMTLVHRLDLFANYRPVLNLPFVQGAAIVFCLGALFFRMTRRPEAFDESELRLRTPVLIVALLLFLLKISMEISACFLLLKPDGADSSQLVLQSALAVMGLWAAYGFGVIIAGSRFAQRALRNTGYVLLGASVVVTSWLTVVHGLGLFADYRPVLNLPFVEGVVAALCLGLLFREMVRNAGAFDESELRFRTHLLIAALLLLLLKISMEIPAYFLIVEPGDVFSSRLRLQSLLTLSLAWALYGGTLVTAGFITRFKPVRLLGISLLGLTVLKVFVLDIQSLDRGYRVAAFVVLGVLLLGVSMLYQRQRRGAEQAAESERRES